MPYFKWYGINLYGEDVYGQEWAFSRLELSKSLFDREIALLNSKSLADKKLDITSFFQRLLILTSSGMLLSEALACMQDIEFIKFVTQGRTLWEVLEGNSNFSRFIVSIVRSGEESGNIVQSLRLAVEHLEQRRDIVQKLNKFKSEKPC